MYSGGCGTVGIEKSKYSVLEKHRRFELRLYEPCVIAETVVESAFADAGNIAFWRLYDYISGENRTRESIAMTAPVGQESRSEKIAMTAPVGQQSAGDKWIVSFLMPSKYTMETLPEPLDPAVTLRVIPARKMASVRYSGTWSQKRYEEHRGRLEEFIENEKWKILGEPVFARYDPPFQLPFLRRNEVLIPVE
ncbi:MAG TPA: heme-binding protein [Sedimentisphaerales bacterium]|nr:heme-binding protein [Sedimentisphaerales bacterium]